MKSCLIAGADVAVDPCGEWGWRGGTSGPVLPIKTGKSHLLMFLMSFKTERRRAVGCEQRLSVNTLSEPEETLKWRKVEIYEQNLFLLVYLYYHIRRKIDLHLSRVAFF